MKAIIYDEALDSGEADGTSYYFTWRFPGVTGQLSVKQRATH